MHPSPSARDRLRKISSSIDRILLAFFGTLEDVFCSEKPGYRNLHPLTPEECRRFARRLKHVVHRTKELRELLGPINRVHLRERPHGASEPTYVSTWIFEGIFLKNSRACLKNLGATSAGLASVLKKLEKRFSGRLPNYTKAQYDREIEGYNKLLKGLSSAVKVRELTKCYVVIEEL